VHYSARSPEYQVDIESQMHSAGALGMKRIPKPDNEVMDLEGNVILLESISVLGAISLIKAKADLQPWIIKYLCWMRCTARSSTGAMQIRCEIATIERRGVIPTVTRRYPTVILDVAI
jgi:hypothetical protein